MRDYTVNNDLTLKPGEVHEHEGKKYKRSYIGGAAFDHEVDGWKKDVNEMWGLWKDDRKKYYKKYHEVQKKLLPRVDILCILGHVKKRDK